METGAVHQINADLLYALDKHEKHRLGSRAEMHVIYVFNPPLTRKEIFTKVGESVNLEEYRGVEDEKNYR